MIINDVLKKKGNEVLTVKSDDVICAAVRIFNKKHIGALMVMDGEEIKGIISERDVVQKIYTENGDIKGAIICDVMTPADKLITCGLNKNIDEVMSLMTSHKIRHIPVVENNKLVGIISIGDIIKAILFITEAEKKALQDYITTPY